MNHIQERILYYLEDLDTRRALGQPPRKLKPTGFTLPENYSFFYFLKPKKLMRICPDCHVDVVYPVELSLSSRNFYIFNLDCDTYTFEYYSADGSVMVDPTYSAPIIARGPIKIIE